MVTQSLEAEIQKLQDKGAIKMAHPCVEQYIPGSKEGWLIQTGSESKTTEPIHVDSSLKDGSLIMKKASFWKETE